MTKKIFLILAITMMGAVGNAGIVKKKVAQIQYNTNQPPIGWYFVNSADVGVESGSAWVWPASKGVNNQLGKLDKNLTYWCYVDYESDIYLPSNFGIYVQVFKTKCGLDPLE